MGRGGSGGVGFSDDAAVGPDGGVNSGVRGRFCGDRLGVVALYAGDFWALLSLAKSPAIVRIIQSDDSPPPLLLGVVGFGGATSDIISTCLIIEIRQVSRVSRSSRESGTSRRAICPKVSTRMV